jgi:O-antigen/teichoic acid export membrane protein
VIVHESRQHLVRLLRNFLVVGAGNYGAMAVSLGINAVLTRRLGVDQFGHLALLLTVSQVLALLGTNWTHSALIRFGAREFAASERLSGAFWTRIWIVLPWLAVAVAAMLGASRPLAAYLMIPRWGLLIVFAHFAASFVLLTAGGVFQAKNAMRDYGLVLFLDKAVMALLLLLLLGSAWTRSPLVILGLYASSSIGVALWGLWRIGLRSLLPIAFDRQAVGAMLGFSLPLLLSSWVGLFGTNWFDILIIKHYRPISEVGLYSLGTVLSGVVQQVTIIFSTLLLPQFSVMVGNGEHDRIRLFVERFLPYWFLATAVLFTLVVLVADPVVPLVFGPAFAPAASVLALLMMATSALALFNAFAPLLTAFGATWALTGTALASGFVNVVMDLALIPAYGIMGAALATTVAYGTSAALVLLWVQRRLHHNVFRLGFLAMPVVLACGCFLVFDAVRFYVCAIPAGVLAVLWLMHHFRLFRGEDAVFIGSLSAAARRVW